MNTHLINKINHINNKVNSIENIFFVYGDNDYLSDEIYTIELELKDNLEKNIKTVVYDRGGYIYHGIIKELAEAAREAGISTLGFSDHIPNPEMEYVKKTLIEARNIVAAGDKAAWNTDGAEKFAEPTIADSVLDGNGVIDFDITRKALDALERALDKVIGEAKDTVVSGDVPAVWSVYNMGHIVKTRDSIFSIDLKHRRANEFVPLLDFALVTHAHKDHCNPGFARAMEKAGKPLASGFLKNSAFAEIKAKARCGDVSVAFWGDRIC